MRSATRRPHAAFLSLSPTSVTVSPRLVHRGALSAGHRRRGGGRRQCGSSREARARALSSTEETESGLLSAGGQLVRDSKNWRRRGQELSGTGGTCAEPMPSLRASMIPGVSARERQGRRRGGGTAGGHMEGRGGMERAREVVKVQAHALPPRARDTLHPKSKCVVDLPSCVLNALSQRSRCDGQSPWNAEGARLSRRRSPRRRSRRRRA
jgi:hypothetical protein